jgi:2,3-dihydroxybiphenyl 1,2-dioxygenase
MGVGSLGYVTLNVTKISEWSDLLEHVFGMEPLLREGSAGARDYRLDDHHHRFTLYPSERDSVAAVGWELESIEKLDALVEALKERGVVVRLGTTELQAERKVKALYCYTCPMIGIETEIYFGPLVSNSVFTPRRDIAGYKTASQGLGHIVFWVKDLAASVKFYQEVMGFNISDYIAWDHHDAVFLHCNTRHHSLALMADGPGKPAGEMMHIMLESTSLDDVGHGYDVVRDRGIPVMLEPGKHSNDHMQSFYLQTPSGFWMEYGFGGREIGSDWEVKSYDQPMLWGHRMVGL